jgi:alkylation response protein AidB-like acyl-CoA dehydrogenase
MFINGGFADIFTVFAKVDGDKFSAFIVERQEGADGRRRGTQDGHKGSSTTPLIPPMRKRRWKIYSAKPASAKIAFNTLNIGRSNLARCVLAA